MSDEYSGSDITQYDKPEIPSANESLASTLPVEKSGYKLVEDIKAAVSEGDGAAAAAIPADIAALGVESFFALGDPIGTLVNAGLTIVLELVEPLNDVLEFVSGDPDEMARSQERWSQISTALASLGEEVGSTVSNDLPNWQGTDAALEQLYALEAIILAASNEAAGIETFLSWAKTLAETLYAVIKAIITELVSFLVTNGLVALALAGVTFGSSVAGFLVRASIKGSMMFVKAMKKFEKAFGIFGKIGRFLFKKIAKSSYRGNPQYALWKAVLVKAGIAGGLAAGVNSIGAITTAAGGTGGATATTPGGSAGQVYIDLTEFEQIEAGLNVHAGRSSGIEDAAQDLTVTEMTWGLPGLLGMESAYQDNCEGILEVLADITAALEGNAAKLKAVGAEWESADQETQAAFENLQLELEG
ncbi:hypothetical protein [Glycomyces arizonensis]|uniref:hypothetical protein n=1 Tax=Glycomyces arizonensis TaxID=256035 RepID=UPI00040B72C5|nr:hypothetical protein [Glycomyces arizonensis]